MSHFKVDGTQTNRDAPAGKWVRRRPRRSSHLLRDLETYRVELEGQNRELRDAQSELEASRHRYADLYHFAPVAYLTLDRAGRILEANLTAVRFFSGNRRFLLGAPLSFLVERSDRAGLRNHLRECLDTRREVATVLCFVGKRRVPSPTQMTSTPLVDGNGEVLGCRTTLTDISALLRTQDRLALLADVSRRLGAAADPKADLQEIVRLIVDRFADVALLDLVAEDGTLRREEQASAAGALAPGASAAWPGGGSPQADLLRGGQSIFVPDCREQTATASGVTARSWMMVPLASRGHTMGLLTLVATERIGHFVTDDLKTAEDLAGRLAVALDNADLHQQALRAKEARDEMLACLAHDLRNPVYAIMLSTAGISDERPSIERRKSWPRLQRVRRNAQHINSMLDDLTELSRFESATFRLTLAPHDVRALLNDVLQSLLPLAEEKRLTLGIDPAVEPGSVRCDSGRVYQVLSNLVANAVKVTPPGAAITLFSRAGDREVLFSVRDTGPGLSVSDRQRMFDKYWQGRTGTRGGRGLGLYIAKRIVEAHGGAIWCDTEPGRGTTVSFTLRRTPS